MEREGRKQGRKEKKSKGKGRKRMKERETIGRKRKEG